MPTLTRHVGRVTDEGVLFLRSLPAWRANLSRLKGHDVELVIRRKSQPVTLDQHGYYRAVVLPLLSEEWGWADPRELHRELKLLHLPGIVPFEDWPVRRVGSAERSEVPSCADLTLEQMSAFIDKVINQAREASIDVPPPRKAEVA